MSAAEERAKFDKMLAEHRVLTHEEAMHVATALMILERHAAGVRAHTAHPDAVGASNVVYNIIGPVGDLLSTMIDCGMIAPRGYTPATA